MGQFITYKPWRLWDQRVDKWCSILFNIFQYSITPPCPNVIGALAKSPMRGWVITSYQFYVVEIHALNPTLVQLVYKKGLQIQMANCSGMGVILSIFPLVILPRFSALLKYGFHININIDYWWARSYLASVGTDQQNNQTTTMCFQGIYCSW